MQSNAHSALFAPPSGLTGKQPDDPGVKPKNKIKVVAKKSFSFLAKVITALFFTLILLLMFSNTFHAIYFYLFK